MNKLNYTAIVIRWIARISGSLVLAFFLFFLLAHLFGNDESGEGFRDTKEVLTFLFFPVSTVIGLSIAWRWEGLGGIITLVGLFGLFIVRPDLLSNAYILIPIIPGMLYVIFWLMTKQMKNT